MRILILDSISNVWLKVFYQKYRGIQKKKYSWQIKKIAGNYTNHLIWAFKQSGHQTVQVLGNCPALQRRWLKEKKLKLGIKDNVVNLLARQKLRFLRKIWQAQLEDYQPDMVYCVAMGEYPDWFLEEAKKNNCLLIGQIASRFSRIQKFKIYDLVVSSLPHFASQFKKNKIKSLYIPLGFGHEVLNKIPHQPKKIVNKVVHIGGYGPIHQERNKFLAVLAKEGILDCYGYGIERLKKDSVLRQCYKKRLVGLDVYRIRQKYSLNATKHISLVAGPYVNNTTIFETTGVDSCLLVDEKKNLKDFFIPGKEVVSYSSANDCLDKAKYLLAHSRKRKLIARAGQKKCLKEHTVLHRVKDFLKALKRL